VKLEKLKVVTNKKNHFIRIDNQIQDLIRKNHVQSGYCVVFVPHTTAGITINENADPDVVRDIVFEMNKIVPADDNYHHMEGNSDAHIKSSMIGPSLTVIIEGGELLLGTWQSIYFCEFDGPRSRNVFVKVIKDN
jgi:secondary thiamine-phosphate synthase enzyme